MKKTILALVLVLLTASIAAADTIYLRDGSTVQGTLLGFVNGRFAIRVDVRRVVVTPVPGPSTVPPGEVGEIRFFRPNEVERIEIDGRSLDDVRYDSRTVEVMLAANWIDTGLDVRRGERLQVKATGTIVAGRTRITPDGLRSTDPTAPLPGAAEGILIGTIGSDSTSPIIELGSTRELVADRDGRLFLTANRGSYTDARGAFSALIRRERDPQAADDGFGPRRNLPGAIRSRNRPRLGETGPVRTPREVTISVPATSRGTDTNIEVRAGDQLTFNASGTIVAGRRVGEVGPEGAASTGFGSILGSRPVPTAGPGALVGYIRLANGQMSQPFLIGSQLVYTAPDGGSLYLLVNDDNYADNSGSFSVRIRY